MLPIPGESPCNEERGVDVGKLCFCRDRRLSGLIHLLDGEAVAHRNIRPSIWLVSGAPQASPIYLQSRRIVASGCGTKLSNPCLDFARLSFPVQLSQERGKVFKCGHNIGMRGAQRLFPDLQSAKKDRFGISISAVEVVRRAEVAQCSEHIRVLPAERLLVDVQRALEE